MPHGRHIYAKASDVAKAKMCTYLHSDHALPHWKFFFGAALNVHISIFLTKKQIKNMKTNNTLN